MEVQPSEPGASKFIPSVSISLQRVHLHANLAKSNTSHRYLEYPTGIRCREGDDIAKCVKRLRHPITTPHPSSTDEVTRCKQLCIIANPILLPNNTHEPPQSFPDRVIFDASLGHESGLGIYHCLLPRPERSIGVLWRFGSLGYFREQERFPPHITLGSRIF